MEAVYAATQRGVVLADALFATSRSLEEPSDTVVIAITGIHGNFYSNPFYYNVGDTLSAAGIDFVYAQTCDAFGQMASVDVRTEERVSVGSWNERFADAVDDVWAWVNYAKHMGYRHVVLAGHSLGANKVIRYLSETHDPQVDRFLLLSPCNVTHLTNQVTAQERAVVRNMLDQGRGQERLPFPLLGWIDCVADTAGDWLFSDTLDNVHVEADADFSQVAALLRHIGMGRGRPVRGQEDVRMSAHATLTLLSDPMQGLVYECQGVFDALLGRYGNDIELRHAMVVLVRDVALAAAVGVRGLPDCLVKGPRGALLVSPLAGLAALTSAIERVRG